MATASSNGGDGAKAFGGIMAIVALAGVFGVLWKPLSDRVTAQAAEMDKLEAAIQRHTDKENHPVLQTQKLTYIEKQLDAIDRQMDADNEREQADAKRFGEINTYIVQLTEQVRQLSYDVHNNNDINRTVAETAMIVEFLMADLEALKAWVDNHDQRIVTDYYTDESDGGG
jgi:hypothetical protein